MIIISYINQFYHIYRTYFHIKGDHIHLRCSKNCHSVYNLEYHLILVTKYRHPVITEDMFRFLKSESERIFALNNIVLEEINYEPDHVHLLSSCPPEIKLSSIINGYKSATSRHIRSKYKDYLSKWYWKPYFWSQSYMLLSSGGAPIEIIRQYIRNQAGDKKQAGSN